VDEEVLILFWAPANNMPESALREKLILFWAPANNMPESALRFEGCGYYFGFPKFLGICGNWEKIHLTGEAKWVQHSAGQNRKAREEGGSGHPSLQKRSLDVSSS
jgi:hypothetical protein